MPPVEADQKQPTPSLQRNSYLDGLIFLIVVAAVLFVAYLLTGNLQAQINAYTTGIAELQERKDTSELLLKFANGLDAALARTSEIFLGFMLIFIGCLHTLRASHGVFRLDLETPGQIKAALWTSSPGLVLATLGVVVIALSKL